MSAKRPKWAKKLSNVEAQRVIDALAQATELGVAESPDGTHMYLRFAIPRDVATEALHLPADVVIPREPPRVVVARVKTEGRWKPVVPIEVDDTLPPDVAMMASKRA